MYSDAQYAQFYMDTYGGRTGVNREYAASTGKEIYENLVEAGYDIELKSVDRYQVSHDDEFYNILDVERGEVAGCYSARYFENAETLAQEFADEMNEQVELRSAPVEDTTCSGGPVRDDDTNNVFIVKPHQRSWYVFHRETGQLKAGPFNNKTLAEDYAVVLNDAAYWRRVALRENSVNRPVYVTYKLQDKWHVYNYEDGPRRPVATFDNMDEAQTYANALNENVRERFGRVANNDVPFLIYKHGNNWYVYLRKIGPNYPITSFETYEQATEYKDYLNRCAAYAK